MNFIKYKNLIEMKGIKLFDHEYRISYSELNNITHNNIQTGGGSANSSVLYRKLKTLEEDQFLNVIKLSLSSNPQYIINLL